MKSLVDVTTRWAGWAPRLRSVLRIVAAFLFMQFGGMKLFGFPIPLPEGHGVTAQMTLAGVLEVFGGAALLLGLFTRPLAFLVSGEMAVAYFQAHAPRGFWALANGGTNAVLFCFVWLYLSAAGPGPWSLDAWRATRRPPAAT